MKLERVAMWLLLVALIVKFVTLVAKLLEYR